MSFSPFEIFCFISSIGSIGFSIGIIRGESKFVKFSNCEACKEKLEAKLDRIEEKIDNILLKNN